MEYVFYFMAFISFLGFYSQANRRNGHGMVYAAVLFAVWVGLGLWFAEVI